MRIGVLEAGELPADLQPRWGLYPDLFARLLAGRGFELVTHRVFLGDVPAAAEAMDGWIITGSRHAVYEDHAWLPPLRALIRDAAARGVPMAGSCFGHQIMAQALGGRVEKSDRGWGVGVHEYDEGGRPLRLCAAHQDQVVEAPAGARVTATSAFCPVAALEWEGAPLASWQGHPEFTTDFARDLIAVRRGTVYPEATADAALASLATEPDSPAVADRIERLFRTARA